MVGDKVLVGSAFREGFTPTSFKNNKGSARAYRRAHRQEALGIPHHSAEGRARRGNLAEQFRRIYRQHRRVDRDDRRSGGGPGLSAGGISRPPISMAASVPATVFTATAWWRSISKTGKVKWYFQFIHHEIWDYDMSSAPLLMDITVDGKPIKAVADADQDGHALCLRPHHRQAGLADPGDARSRRAMCRANGIRRPSPFPSKPAPYARTGVSVDELIDFTPALHAEGAGDGEELQDGPDLHAAGAVQRPAARSPPSWLGPANGGTNWPGGSFNPENHTVYIYACNSCLSADGAGAAAAGLDRHALCRRRGGPARS